MKSRFILGLFIAAAALVSCTGGKQVGVLTEPTSAISDGNLDFNAEMRFARVVQYIDSNISRELTLESLAEHFYFDKSYLTMKFKEVWRISPMRYISRIRLERAKVLLSNTDKSITEIAILKDFQIRQFIV